MRPLIHGFPTLAHWDMQTIADGVWKLPGDWEVDPVIDMRRPRQPRVLIRSKSLPDYERPIAFERCGRFFWVSRPALAVNDSGVTTGVPFESIEAAFTYLCGVYEAVTAAITGMNAAKVHLSHDGTTASGVYAAGYLQTEMDPTLAIWRGCRLPTVKLGGGYRLVKRR